ncbi:tRNA (adenosine(37)-N6)-threonylcarbamoyltransferase complex transferase subunit TsaD [Verrucomicrobiota bacterium]
MNVLGIETSCDETSAAVVVGGRNVASNVIFSQVSLHRPYGGVVPEIASRHHVESLPGIIEEAVNKAGLSWDDIDAVAATYGPGLASSLLVGISAAKGLALRLNKPLCAINHLEAHIYSAFLGDDAPVYEELCPFIALVVSGGHTSIIRVEGLGKYELLGQTIDDAAGEAFDKGANLLGLGYPGGPAIDKAGRDGNKKSVHFPRGVPGKKKWRFDNLDPDLCFSFSGLKTSLLYYLKEHPLSEGREEVSSLAASYQEAIVDSLMDRCKRAVGNDGNLVVVGGVSLNSRLRERLKELAGQSNIRLFMAEPQYCADNAAMIAGLAGSGQGIRGEEAITIDASPNVGIG